MNRDPVSWVTRMVAFAVMAGVVLQTLAALRVTGAFGWHAAPSRVPVPFAYQSVDRALDRRDAEPPPPVARDPFAFGPTPAPPPRPRPEPTKIASVPESAPVLTAIVWDNDPRALVHWKDREWTIREGGLFDEFQVVSITRDQVRLTRGGATLVLQRRNPGD